MFGEIAHYNSKPFNYYYDCTLQHWKKMYMVKLNDHQLTSLQINFQWLLSWLLHK